MAARAVDARNQLAHVGREVVLGGHLGRRADARLSETRKGQSICEFQVNLELHLANFMYIPGIFPAGLT